MRKVQLSVMEQHKYYVTMYVAQRNNNTIILQIYVVTVNTFLCIYKESSFNDHCAIDLQQI